MISAGLDLSNNTSAAVWSLTQTAAGRLAAVLQLRGDISRTTSLMAQALTATTVGQIEGLIEDPRGVHEQTVEPRKPLDPGPQKADLDAPKAPPHPITTPHGAPHDITK